MNLFEAMQFDLDHPDQIRWCTEWCIPASGCYARRFPWFLPICCDKPDMMMMIHWHQVFSSVVNSAACFCSVASKFGTNIVFQVENLRTHPQHHQMHPLLPFYIFFFRVPLLLIPVFFRFFSWEIRKRRSCVGGDVISVTSLSGSSQRPTVATHEPDNSPRPAQPVAAGLLSHCFSPCLWYDSGRIVYNPNLRRSYSGGHRPSSNSRWGMVLGYVR